ncbi:proteasomal ubiquitin receptor ADRM1 homolog [Anopheles moucheti]|uniref:proteasomal ubiquitin receptor ADRM1 homolog n=1 Tax=Anopheles moucheti TaxID=186751 RepID=UPI0022F0624F|nr:proteasomal ubiquitin receptor ADRM1 homolog [Anopheles moucheti]XP_052896360.1 proteasomal ubiquitin receptor ADRM1 homolog [Anopheles moucheti]XP_052896362.1 proteasomal ubiquitin receptor ADRM1 homolog [Anopheles moucheti]
MSGPIFGSSSALGGSSGGNRHLVEFRAGRMNMVNKMVHADNRKGLVYVYQAEDGLIHFCWKDRTSGTLEDDLILFPDDCEFKKLDYVKNGRVYVLKFKSSSRRLFFWMQEPKTDRDDEWCRRINEVINNPPSGNSIGSGGRSSGTDNGDLQYMLNNMSQQQIMQLFGGVGQMGGLSSLLGSMTRSNSGNSSSRTSAATPSNRTLSSSNNGNGSSTTTPTAALNAPSTPRAPKKTSGTTKPTSGSGSATSSPMSTPVVRTAGNTSNNAAAEGGSRILLSDLQNYLSGISATGVDGSGSRQNIDLASAVNSQTLASIISDQDKVDALVAHLPQLEGDENKKEQLKETISSPQFQQALSMFSNALQSGQLGPVVSQFQLNAEAVAAANAGDLEQFVKALENSEKSPADTAAATSKQSTGSATAAGTASEQPKSSEVSKEENGHGKAQKKDQDDEMAG